MSARAAVRLGHAIKGDGAPKSSFSFPGRSAVRSTALQIREPESLSSRQTQRERTEYQARSSGFAGSA
ncbi:MAG TPA: hypothetical protein VHA77_07830, partial [Xanthobacteraceae bacterium]|nr:hypothetical protein [Xanthobacteraceae bacterium]